MVKSQLTGLPLHSTTVWTNLRASVWFQSGILQAYYEVYFDRFVALLATERTPRLYPTQMKLPVYWQRLFLRQ